MSVFHIHKRELPFVQVDKHFINDARLSYKAKGILLYLLSKPDDWKVYESEIAKHAADKLHSVRSGIKELIEFGYITRQKKRNEQNQFMGYDYNVFEQPANPDNSTVMRFSENGKSQATNNDINSDDDFEREQQMMTAGGNTVLLPANTSRLPFGYYEKQQQVK
ncbi:MAG: helix-turn-helix domain-containing protein [Negativicutes bacterium]|nr:helix-turn-helix domain-containing protein [Negativicutes bacterium]